MAFVRTVLGDIEPDDLGVCYAHEHIIIDGAFVGAKYPDFKLDSVDRAVEELREVYAAGGRAMVDSMPCAAGRNVLKMAEVSRRSSIHLLIPTGLHLPIYYPADHWSNTADVDSLACLFIADIETGIDRHDYNGTDVERTEHRAGLIKVATGATATERETRIFEAAAQAHARTGCPILTHTEQGERALDQVEMLRQGKVRLDKVVLSHTDRQPDPVYHREILSSGVCVEYDSGFRWKDRADNPTFDLILELMEEFPSQIMIGMDAARRAYWLSYGGKPGLAWILETMLPALETLGLTEELRQAIMVQNPRRAYSFAE